MREVAPIDFKNRKLALLLFTFFDLLAIVVLWLGYQTLKNYFIGVNDHGDVIKFSSRTGFYTVGLLIPMIHLFGLIEYFSPAFIKKHMTVLNTGAIAALVIFLFSGFYISSWMKSNLENSGYIYCREVSGVSALARSLVYTKDLKTCEELVEIKQRDRR